MKKVKVFFAFACIALIAAMTPLASHAVGSPGDPVEVEGDVIDVGDRSITIADVNTLDTDDNPIPVTIYGMGPDKFWEDHGVASPDVWDYVIVTAVEVTFPGDTAKFPNLTKLIAMEVTFSDGTLIILRDGVATPPRWRMRQYSGAGDVTSAQSQYGPGKNRQ